MPKATWRTSFILSPQVEWMDSFEKLFFINGDINFLSPRDSILFLLANISTERCSPLSPVCVSVWVCVVFWLIFEVSENIGGKLWFEVDYYNSLSLAQTEK